MFARKCLKLAIEMSVCGKEAAKKGNYDKFRFYFGMDCLYTVNILL